MIFFECDCDARYAKGLVKIPQNSTNVCLGGQCFGGRMKFRQIQFLHQSTTRNLTTTAGVVLRLRKQVAEPAAHFAEGKVDVKGEILAALVLPDLI